MIMVNKKQELVIIMSESVQKMIIGFKKIIPPKDKEDFMKWAKQQAFIQSWVQFNQELTNMGVVRLDEYQDPTQNQN